MRRLFKRTAVAAVLVVSLCFFGAWQWAKSLQFPSPERDIGKYEKWIRELRPSGLVDHFPKNIPAHARDARLYLMPGFLQGGMTFQLWFKLPPEEIARIHEDATSHAKDFYDGGFANEKVNSSEKGLPGTSFSINATEQDDSFPKDYRIFVFDAKDHGGGFSWNHGTSRGVVVSKERNEVLYYAESW